MGIRTGLQVFVEDGYVEEFRGLNVGVVVNHTSVHTNGSHLIDILLNSGVSVKAIFTPEHGLKGDLPAGEAYGDSTYGGIPVYSLYGPRVKPPQNVIKGLDALIFDIQDVGVRFYTYISTLFNVLESAGEAGVEVVVLDRPNPLTGIIVEGPILENDLRSFIGIWTLPIRYGLTIGELARLFNSEAKLGVRLRVVEMDGWRRGMWYDETGLPWLRPSPAMVSLGSALAYPGFGLFEGTNVNEGRGTDEPFQVIGAPWLDPVKIIDEASALGLRGFELEPIEYVPRGSGVKYSGLVCRGIKVKVTDRLLFRPVKLALGLMWIIARVHRGLFEFRRIGDSFHFDYLAGRRVLRRLITGGSIEDVFAVADEGVGGFSSRASGYFLY